MTRKLWQPFYTFWALATFILSILVLIIPIFIMSIGNNLSSRKMIHGTVRYWALMWLRLIAMPPRYIGSFPKNNRYVIVANHISYIDALVTFAAIPEYYRPLGKKEFGTIPLLGFVYKQVAILVDRSNSKSRAESMRNMQDAVKDECHVMIFPEGTFNETEETLKVFYNGAFDLAVKTQTEILPIIFPDTVNRWHYSAWWKLCPGRNRIVYLPPVSAKDKDVTMLKNEVYDLLKTGLEDYK